MSNQIYSDDFFNPNQKEMYLKNMSEKTREAYSRILKRAKYVEDQINKDLYNFNVSEIEQLMTFMSPTTYSASFGNLNVVRGYIRWAIQQDLRDDNINPLDTIMSDEFVNKFIDKTNKYFFTSNEIDTIVGGLENFQDSAIVQCIFEGIVGNKYSEILNILKKDIDRNSNVLQVKNKPSVGQVEYRDVEVSTKLMNLLYSAAYETSYIKGNGDVAANNKSPEIELIDNEYVFRSAKLHVKYLDSANSHLILRRLSNIAKWEDYPHLNVTNIKKSGMIKYAKDLYDISGKLEREEINKVCEKFNINSISTTRLTKDFLNLDTISILYA